MKSKKLPKDLLDQLIRACRRSRRLATISDETWHDVYQVCIAYAHDIERATGQSWLHILHIVEAAIYFNTKATNQDIYDVFSATGLCVTDSVKE